MPERMSVSEPKLMERTSKDVNSHLSHVNATEVDLDMGDFDQMLVCVKVQVRYSVLLRRGLG